MIGILTSLVAYFASRNQSVRKFAQRIAQSASQRGINFIKQWEGFEALPYKDIAGFKTVGFGTKLNPGDPLYNVTAITQPQGEKLMQEHIKREIDPAISRYVKVPLTQNQYDALVSFIYNFGAGKFRTSTLLKRLNARRYRDAADQFLRWNKAMIGGELREVAGLSNRRQAERELFLS